MDTLYRFVIHGRNLGAIAKSPSMLNWKLQYVKGFLNYQLIFLSKSFFANRKLLADTNIPLNDFKEARLSFSFPWGVFFEIKTSQGRLCTY